MAIKKQGPVQKAGKSKAGPDKSRDPAVTASSGTGLPKKQGKKPKQGY